MIFRRTLFSPDDISRIKSVFPGFDVQEFSSEVLVHYRNPELNLEEKIAHLLDIYCSLPVSEADRYESRLYLAAVELTRGHHLKALHHLDAASEVYSPISSGGFPGKDKPFFYQFNERLLPYPVEYSHRLLQEALRDRVDELLISNADKALRASEPDEALVLLSRVREADGMSERVRWSYFFVLGEAWKQKGG